MTTYLGKSCSFCLPRVPFVNCRQFMYLVISLFGFEGRMWDLIVFLLRTLFTGSHVHTSFSCLCLIHWRANILQVKHHVNWFTSRSSIASSNVHISFTLADQFRRFHPCSSYLHTIFTNTNPVHKFTSISYTNAPFNCSNVHIPLYHEITFERVRSVRNVSWEI